MHLDGKKQRLAAVGLSVLLTACPAAMRVEAGGVAEVLTERIELVGAFVCGASRHDVTGHVVLHMGSISNLTLSIGSEAEPLVRLEVRASTDRGGSLTLSDKTFPVDNERLARWTSFFHLTWGGLAKNMTFKRSDTDVGQWVLESHAPMSYGEGLPVKMRCLFSSTGSGEGVKDDAKPDGVTVYSLAEWNNRFNDNVVLRLRLRRETISER